MINQSKINSFISLIAKAHSDKKQRKYRPFPSKGHCHTEQSCQEIFDKGQFQHENDYSLDQFTLHHTHDSFKQTLKDKIQGLISQANGERKKKTNNLYELYRQSMEKKKSKIRGNDREGEFSPSRKRSEARVKKDINFPISRPTKSNPKSNSFSIMKKRQLTTQCPLIEGSPNDPLAKMQSQNSQKSKIFNVNFKKKSQTDNYDEKRQTKPFFRVKRCSQFRQNEIIDEKQELEIEKKREQRCKQLKKPRFCLKTYLRISASSEKASQTHGSPRNRRYLKNSEKIMRIDRVDPWDYDQKESSYIFQDL